MRKTVLRAVLNATIFAFIASFAQAGSATWDLNPGSGDWNTATNWTPATVPDGSADTATFALSNTTNVSISANTEVDAINFTPAATNPYTITSSPSFTLTVSGTGITNNSGATQNFVTAADALGNSGTIIFSNNATAGTNVFFANQASSANFFASGGETIFKDRSTAGSAAISNESDVFGFGGGETLFLSRSTAGSANILNEGFSAGTQFFGRSTAGSANILNGDFGFTQFFNSSTAGSATIQNDFGITQFFDSSTAGRATISDTDKGDISFFGRSTAGSANIQSASVIDFEDSSSAGSAIIQSAAEIFFAGSSKGGTAAIVLFFSALEIRPFLDMSSHNAPGMTIGSVEGDANSFVFLGANNLRVGSNNLSTTFSGVIQDGGQNGGVGGSLTKIGSGALDLTGANYYTGDTTVSSGTLLVNNSTGSATGSGAVHVTGGTLGGTGIIAGAVTVGTGSGGGALISPGSSPGTLTIESTLTLNSDAIYRFELNSSAAIADKIVANGVTINGAAFSFTDLGDEELAPGTTFVIIDNTSNSAIRGFFSNLTDNSEFSDNGNTYEVSYEGGSGNDLTLTVAPGNVPVPDQGSTLLLFSLSVLGLVCISAKFQPA